MKGKAETEKCLHSISEVDEKAAAPTFTIQLLVTVFSLSLTPGTRDGTWHLKQEGTWHHVHQPATWDLAPFTMFTIQLLLL